MQLLKACSILALVVSSCLAAKLPTLSKIDITPCREVDLGIPCPEQKPRKLIRIEQDSLAVPIVHQAEDVNFAVNRSSSGFSQVTGVGVTVQRGVSADLRYNITVTAITSREISSLTESIVESLNTTELEILDSLLQEYDNGLSVPSMQLLGINLGGVTNAQSQTIASTFIERYNELSESIEELLESTEESSVAVVGSLTATGVSLVPVEGFVFIRTARMFLNDGTSRLVVTSDPAETEAATDEGDVLPSTNRNLFTGPPSDVPLTIFG